MFSRASKLSKRRIPKNSSGVNPIGSAFKSHKYHQYLYRAHVAQNLLDKYDKDVQQNPSRHNPYQITNTKLNFLAEIFLFNAAGHLLRDIAHKKTPEESIAIRELINYYAGINKNSYQYQMIDDCIKFIADQRKLGFGNGIPYEDYDNYLLNLNNIRKAHDRDWNGKNTYSEQL